jgi:hypothetical protein
MAAMMQRVSSKRPIIEERLELVLNQGSHERRERGLDPWDGILEILVPTGSFRYFDLQPAF